MKVEKPWGYEEEIKGNERYSLWRLNIYAGQETSLHCHPGKDVFLVAEFGQLVIEREESQELLNPGDTSVIERGTFHRLKAPHGATVLEVEWPNNREDIVRKEDRYGRCE